MGRYCVRCRSCYTLSSALVCEAGVSIICTCISNTVPQCRPGSAVVKCGRPGSCCCCAPVTRLPTLGPASAPPTAPLPTAIGLSFLTKSVISVDPPSRFFQSAGGLIAHSNVDHKSLDIWRDLLESTTGRTCGVGCCVSWVRFDPSPFREVHMLSGTLPLWVYHATAARTRLRRRMRSHPSRITSKQASRHSVRKT